MAFYKQILPPEKGLEDNYTTGELNADSGEFLVELGTRVFDEEGRVHVFCEVANNAASTGAVVAYSDPGNHKVDPAASADATEQAAGVVLAGESVATGEGCWVQKNGVGRVGMQTDNAVSANDQLVKDSSNAGVVTSADDLKRIGRAYGADSSSVLSAGNYDLIL